MDLGHTLGAMLIGILASMILYGAVSIQMIIYLLKFVREDRRSLVATACILWLLDTVHIFIGGNYLYHNLLMNYCNPPLITTKVDDLSTGIVAVVTFIVHGFYARRIWILSRRNWWLTGIICILATTHFAFELVALGYSYKHPRYDQFHHLEEYFVMALSIAAILDVLIAGMLVYLLNQNKSGIKSTETSLNMIAAYAISSGALTSITDVIILICVGGYYGALPFLITGGQYLGMPDNLVYLAIYTSICELYTIALLTSLNAREFLRNIQTDVSSSASPTHRSRLPAAGGSSTASASGKSVSSVVHISSTTTV
ncbi:hypothetical protein PILCRDRAFT_16890 [Piloderma croceum F 1598]|uniref:DUF6534 domain-containing protein n=1 Tax=Piloderma croceum (strain F 1598) TaxID=765440 RepID=A0A0C3EUZ4_PILCF|nr:hypothetical protein PILCRDRAFT_16890 [Piloderma croceum F 1598]